MSTRGNTRGVVYVHSSPTAVCPHVEWAISGTLDARAELRWTPQPAAPGQLRALAAGARGGESFAFKVDELLGASWDEALEPYRRAGDGAPITWLHQVG